MFGKLKEAAWTWRRRLVNPKRSDPPGSSPYLSGDDFRGLCDFVFDDAGLTFVPADVHEGALIFVKAYPPLVDYFFRQLHPRIHVPYRLLTHNEDRAMPGDHAAWLDDPKLLHWYTTNRSLAHPKVTAIPIGILNRRASDATVALLNRWSEAGVVPENRAYVNFHIGDAGERAPYRAKRQVVFEHFAGKAWATVVSERISQEVYFEDIARHRFIISPPGHGPDCYRHWEAMLLGVLPVVEMGVGLDAFAEFPMIQVESWDEVDLDFLIEAADALDRRSFDRNRLYFDYWERMIVSSSKLSQ